MPLSLSPSPLHGKRKGFGGTGVNAAAASGVHCPQDAFTSSTRRDVMDRYVQLPPRETAPASCLSYLPSNKVLESVFGSDHVAETMMFAYFRGQTTGE